MQPPVTDVPLEVMAAWPDHTQLPDTDGSIVENTQQSPQSNILTESLQPRLLELHPDEQFCIGEDVGIYFRFTDPVLSGCRAPDWFYVPNVPPMVNGDVRRSYVLWKESVPPVLVVEYVSGNGSEEHDATPQTGKFWIYEQSIKAEYYAIFDRKVPSLELFRLVDKQYTPVAANAAGRYPVEPLGVELFLWEAKYRRISTFWIRVWDSRIGQVVPIPHERIEGLEATLEETRELLDENVVETRKERKRADEADKRADELAAEKEKERKRADEATKRADEAVKRAEQFAAKLLAAGIALDT